jgi:hypothetical protein
VRDSSLPWTTLRATQFRDAFLIMGKQIAKMPFVPVFAGVRFQPIDAGEVPGRLYVMYGEDCGHRPSLMAWPSRNGERYGELGRRELFRRASKIDGCGGS